MTHWQRAAAKFAFLLLLAHVALHVLSPVSLLADGWADLMSIGGCIVCWLRDRLRN